MFKLRTLFITLIIALTAFAAGAQERITDFTVDIDVARTGDITVTENISVISEGQSIRRGIFRDLPRYLLSEKGQKIEQKYEILSVTRDDKREPYSKSTSGNALQIRIGDANVFLKNGAHKYAVQYRLPNAVRRFEGFDELYWNATGTYWKFPIATATVNVSLPDNAIPTEVNGYTGRFGESGKNYVASAKPGLVNFKTTRSLSPREGITVSVVMDKGVIAPLSPAQKAGQWWQFNGIITLLSGLLTAIGAFYYNLWNKVGRDPARQPVFARYEPPKDYSAAACRQVLYRRSYSQKTLIATLMGLAHKGRITLDAQKKVTTIHAVKNPHPDGPPLNIEEADLYKRLFGGVQDLVILDGKPNSSFVSKIGRFKQSVAKRYGRSYYKGNVGLSIKGILASIVGGGLILVLAPGGVTAPVIALLVGLLALNIYMPKIIAAPTVKGQKLRAEIEGLKLYMETAEEGRINSAKAPDDETGGREPLMSAERYEQLMPYAVALDVEKPWSRYFEKIMPVEAKAYRPTGMTGNITPGDLSRTTRDMVSAVSSGVSRAVPPSSSSSGSSGGGSSGGGGGGGGGGGW